MILVDIVFAASVFLELFAGFAGDPGPAVSKRSRIKFWIFDRRIDVDMVASGRVHRSIT
jgi:hypothetical protein